MIWFGSISFHAILGRTASYGPIPHRFIDLEDRRREHQPRFPRNERRPLTSVDLDRGMGRNRETGVVAKGLAGTGVEAEGTGVG